jgi:hypothetical protein
VSDTIVWVHLDALSPTNPALTSNPDAPAVFVFDDAYLAARKFSLKRVLFIYECLLEMPVTILRGDLAEQVIAFAQEHGATQIVTTESVDPYLKAACEKIRKGQPEAGRLEFAPVEPFAAVDNSRLDLKRFTRYWGAVKRLALHE